MLCLGDGGCACGGDDSGCVFDVVASDGKDGGGESMSIGFFSRSIFKQLLIVYYMLRDPKVAISMSVRCKK